MNSNITEAINNNDAQFLAGIWEAGGTMDFFINRKRYKTSQYCYAYPRIACQEKRSQVLEDIQKVAGGGICPTKDTHRWSKVGPEIVDLTSQIFPFTPSRQETITAFQNWEQAEDLEEKLAIAQDLEKEREFPDEQSYRNLVNSPNFLSGIYATRGHTYPNGLRGAHITRFSSQNKPLLQAVKTEVGGSDIDISHQKGDKVTILGKEVIIKRTGYVLELLNDETREFLTRIHPTARSLQPEIENILQCYSK